MSLVTSSICMAKRNIPVDVINVVIEFIGANPNARWIPRFNLEGKLCWSFNKTVFDRLSTIYSFKPTIYKNFRCTPINMVINGVEQENTCSIMLIAPKLINLNIVRTIVYASVEISPNVFTHASVLCDWGVGEIIGVSRVYKGSLYRPYETHILNREQQIYSMDINHHTISIVNSEVSFQNVWNPELNIWEYVVYDDAPTQIDPYPIWVHDTEE